MRSWLDVFVLVMMYLSGLTLLVWGLLKAFGVINTPVWVLAVPYVAGAIPILGMVYYLGKMANRLEHMDRSFVSYGRMRDDFVDVRNRQRLCLSGQLDKSPYGKS